MDDFLSNPPYVPNWTDTNLDPSYWWIEVGPFFDRFGSKKLAILSSTDTTVQAIVLDSTVRKFIDLKRPDVATAIQVLVNKGLLTQADGDAIIQPPTTDYERHIKGLTQPQ